MVYRAEAQPKVLVLLTIYSYCHISPGRDTIQILLSPFFFGEKLVDVGCTQSFFLMM
jgi:hypothetical protein